PGAAASDEDQGSPAIAIAPRCSDQCAVGGERNGVAELVVRGPVARDELLLLGPRATASDENVRCTARGVILERPNERVVAGERDGPTELVALGPVARDELLLFGPGAATSDEDVGCAAIGVIPVGPDE